MMVENEISTVEYQLSTSTGPFDIPFYFIENDHIVAQIYDPSDDNYNPTTLVLNQDYYLSGAGDQSGGQLTLLAAHNGKTLFIYRDPAATQLTSYQDTGKFPAASHERALDKLTMLIQRIDWWWNGLALKKPNRFANYYDAEGNRIANLADPVNDQDAATKHYVEADFSRTLRVPEASVPVYPDVATRKNMLVGCNDEGKFVPIAGQTETIDLALALAASTGYQLIGGLAEHYSPPSSVIVVDNAPYNGDLKAALDAATDGSTLWLGKKDYDITGYYATGRNTKKNIMIVGLGMPEYASDWSRFVSGSGTVIQGAVKNQAKGFKIFNLGIDCGNYVSQNVYPTVTYEDGLQIYGVGSKANVGLDSIRTLNSLGVSSNPGTHSILLEQLEGVTLGYVECCGGFHGLTIKCQNLRGGRAHLYGQYGDAFILKSDSGGPCRDIRMDSITVGLIDNSLLPTVSLGGIYDAHDGVTIDNISIGDLRVQNASWGLIPASGATGYTSHVTIGNYYASQVYGNYYSLEVGNQCVNWNIGSHQCSGVSGGIKINASAQYITLGEGTVTSSTNWGYSFAASTFAHGLLISNGNYGGVEYVGGTGFNPANVIAYNNTNGNFSALPSVLTGSVLNGWTTQTDFKAVPNGHRVFISGSLTKGTAANAWLIANNLRPAVDTPISAWGISSGGSMVPVEAYVRANGNIEITGYASLGSAQAVRINGSYLIA